MQVATFVIAVFGAVVAAGSATWNVAQWRLSGGRAKVRLVMGNATPSGLMVGEPSEATSRNIQRLAEIGFAKQVVGVEVSNVGRAAITVQSWALKTTKTEVSYIPITDSVGPPLPCTIDPGAQQTWVVDMQEGVSLLHTAAEFEGSDGEKICGTARLGTGQQLQTEKSVRLQAP